MTTRQFRLFLETVVWMWVWSWACLHAPAQPHDPAEASETLRPALATAIHYSEQTRVEPRPLRVYVLRIDLQAAGFEVAVAVGDDPDGDGPAEAQLTDPRVLASRAGFVAAVNTNPWAMIPAKIGLFRTPYVAGGGCDITGWALADGVLRSPPQAGHWNFWIDAQRRARLGPQTGNHSTQQAVAGFGGLLQQGKILPAPSTVLHPRTALGLDPEGRWLTLAVVDGRQKGYSEGMSELELAALMAELGCSDALNLDGGGSSAMLLKDEAGRLQFKNRPSDSRPRPVPVMLGMRRRS